MGIAVMLLMQKFGNPTSPKLTVVFVPLTLVLAVSLLRPVKGACSPCWYPRGCWAAPLVWNEFHAGR
jgi:uncharacterized protein (DUF983 family)